MNELPNVVAVAAWGFGGGLLAGLYPLVQASKTPENERVDKDRLWYIINLIVLPFVGAFVASLARTKCINIDPVMATFAGFAGPSLLQKWERDHLIL